MILERQRQVINLSARRRNGILLQPYLPMCRKGWIGLPAFVQPTSCERTAQISRTLNAVAATNFFLDQTARGASMQLLSFHLA